MPPPVRVIGRVDLAEQIGEAVRTAGFDAEVVTASPMSVGAPLVILGLLTWAASFSR